MFRNGHLTRSLSSLFFALLLLLGACWYLNFRVVAPLQFTPLTDGFHGNDFRHIYLGSWLLSRGENPYDAPTLMYWAQKRGFQSVNPYVYLPFTGLALAPLALLDPKPALLTWFWMNHVFMVGGLLLLFLSLEARPSVQNVAFFVLTVALCFPLHRTLTAGQLNCTLFFLYALTYFFEKRDHQILCGATAAFAFLFKLAPGILFLYFLWKRAWKSLAAMCISTLLLLGLTFWWGAGWKIHLAFLPLLKDMGFGKSTWSAPELGGMHFFRDATNQSFNSFFHHILSPADQITPWLSLGPGAANACTWIALIACLALAAWRLEIRPRQGGVRTSRAISYGIFVLLSLLAPSLYWDHYVVIALWPFLACYVRLQHEDKTVAFAWMLLGALTIWALLEGRVVFFFMAHPDTPNLNHLPLGLMTVGLFLLLPAAIWALSTFCRARYAGFWQGWMLGVSGALLLARFPFDIEAFHSGVGLLAMSLKLWGTLLLFALCLWMVNTRNSNDNTAGAVPQMYVPEGAVPQMYVPEGDKCE